MDCCTDRALLRPLLKSGDRSRNSSTGVSFAEEMGDKTPRVGLCFRRVRLLLWKNFLLRRRHYLVTLLEIILPTIFAMLLAFMRTQNRNFTIPVNNVTFYDEHTEMNLIGKLEDHLGRDSMIAYAPSNPITDRIIRMMQTQIPGRKIELKSFKTEKEVESFSAQLGINITKDASNNFLKAAIIFEKGLENEDFGLGHTISYKIRLVNEFHDISKDLFPWFQFPGPVKENEAKYSDNGFAGLQVILDQILIQTLTGNPSQTNISMEAFPYPPYILSIDFANFYFILLPQFIVLGFIFIVPSIIRGVVSEKETGIKELMKLMGLPNWMHWLGWMLNSLIVLVLSISIVIFLFFYKFSDESGAVLNRSDPTLWWFVLFLYGISATSFCFFIASLFKKPTLATTIGIVAWLVSYYAFATTLEQKYQSISFLEKMSVAMLPNMALQWAIKIMSGLEGKAVGAQWWNICEPISSVDPLSLGYVFLMFVINTFVYLTLTIYFENILPSDYGIRKPWYYPFMTLRYCLKKRVENDTTAGSNVSLGPADGFEKEPNGLNPGIEITNLSKTFGKNKRAVDRVSFKMYDGQITAFLGHNGAGKTTTISVLTGLFSPTSGTAKVNGYDIKTEMDEVRKNLGLCPQHNMLFDKLTVKEHLLFFGQLKGLSKERALFEAKDLVKKLQLELKMNSLSMNLSGGQKRKLSLGIALIGSSKVVILDEPTSGMDPEARRAIWDLLLEMRGERTILLTTHFMEEADVLGDRIAIMADGKIKCCGTPMFLKQFYGTGYTLRVTKDNNSDPNLILTSIQKYSPNAKFKINVNAGIQSSTEIAIAIPSEGNPTSKFPEMFSNLMENKDLFGIVSLGLSLTTMDEVFIKVGELAHHPNDTDNELQDMTSQKPIEKTVPYNSRISGFQLTIEQFKALFKKRFIYTMRKKRLFISQMLLPILLLIIAITVSNEHFEGQNPPPELRFGISPYKKPITIYSSSQNPKLGEAYKEIVGSSAKAVPDVLNTLVEIGEKDLTSFREQYIVAANFNTTNAKAFFSTIPYHAAPLSLNLVSNAILRNMDPVKKFNLEIVNHPLQSGLDTVVEAAKTNPIFATTVPMLFSVFIPIGLALLAASFIVFPVEERLCKAKQLQLMTGVNPFVYWYSSFLWDFFLMFILICLMTICFPIFQTYGVFTNYNAIWVIFLVLVVYGFSAISFSYLLSNVVATVPGGFALVTVIHILSGMIMVIIVFSLELGGLVTAADKIRPVGRLFPTFGAGICVMRFAEIATKNSRCSILSSSAKEIVCNPNVPLDPDYRSCCDNCQTFGICFQPHPFFVWKYEKELTGEVPGIGQELLYMFIMALVYQVLLFIVEFGLFNKVIRFIFRADPSLFKAEVTDLDVKDEKNRISQLLNTGRSNEDGIIIKDFCKSYGSLAAVSNLSFGVRHGECFGLLGVNGAGKTTSFRILTGDEVPSNGNSFLEKYSLDANRKLFLSKIGYCPQFDGIVDVLSGREMLELFAALRGIPHDFIRIEADKWLEKVGLTASSHVQCGKYSGGMKRRLSAAMAMIGDSPVILLDEPTSGVDPASRRQFWKVISSVMEAGQAVILTSHSMEECEVLCTRLGIMVNGQLQCLGRVQHLKDKFAQGYSLTIKLKVLLPPESDMLKLLQRTISQKFQNAMLKDQHQNILQYHLGVSSIPWNVLFASMEEIKSEYEDIVEEYSINETSLEEVFLSFARKQYSNRDANISIVKRILTCQLCTS